MRMWQSIGNDHRVYWALLVLIMTGCQAMPTRPALTARGNRRSAKRDDVEFLAFHSEEAIATVPDWTHRRAQSPDLRTGNERSVAASPKADVGFERQAAAPSIDTSGFQASPEAFPVRMELMDDFRDGFGAPPTRSGTAEALPSNVFESIAADYQHFYSSDHLAPFALGVGAAAMLTNTSADRSLLDLYTDNVTYVKTDEYKEAVHEFKFLGDGRYTLPVFGAVYLADQLIDAGPVLEHAGEWGERSLRTFLVGGPPVLGLQYLLGASRPYETPERSEWQPFQDNNGVSGHAFMGAIPFLSAAHMTDDVRLKTAFFIASTLPGLSRINDEDHYPSQVFLGWWIAFLASSSVEDTFQLPDNVSVYPMMMSNGMGLGLEVKR